MGTIRDCKQIQAQLNEYVDGVLDTEASWKVNLHLQGCAVCARAADELSSTASLLANLPALEPSVSFEDKLAARLAERVLQPRPATWWERATTAVRDGWNSGLGAWNRGRVVPALASGVAVAAIAPLLVVLYQNGQTPQSAPTPESIVRTTTNKAGQQAPAPLERIWQEHDAYASSEPLGNAAGLLASDTSGY
jgi:anti-sigma factor RsiW